MIYDYPVAFSHWGEEEWIAIQKVLRIATPDAHLNLHEPPKLTMGEHCKEFEREFAAYHGKKHGIMVNSGSSANLVAIAALFYKAENPLKLGDKVLVPAIAWSTTYAPLVQYGLDLIIADVDDTWNCPVIPNWYELDVRLIVGVSILGNPGYFAGVKGQRHEMVGWEGVAQRIGAYFFEDNCESLGAETYFTLGSRKCGTFGNCSTFSFFHSHQLSAIEGGMVLTDDDEIADLCRMLRAHGWTRDLRVPERFSDEYDFHVFGYNVRPLELHAAIAREQLKKLDLFRRARTQCWNNFELLTRDLPIQVQKPNGITSPFGFAFTVRNTEIRSQLVKALREKSIDCRLPTGGSFRKHPYAKQWSNQQTPYADHVHDCGLFLGCSATNINDKLERAAGVIAEVCR